MYILLYTKKYISYFIFAQFAVEENCARMDFSVLNWNPAEKFYKRKGAIDITKSDGWHIYRMGQAALHKISQKHH